MLGHEVVRALSLADVVADRGGTLHTLAEDPGHEKSEVPDVPRHRHLMLGLEVRSVPGGARFQQQVHYGLQARDRGAPRVQVLGPREAGQQVGEVRRGRVVTDGQVVEARSNRPLEKGAKLHIRDDSKFSILLEFEPVADRPSARFPWFLVAASALLVLLVLYVLFVGYLPAKQRVAGLEAELKELYKREAELQTRIVQQENRYALRERQIAALTTERDTLIRRLEELEKLLAAARGQRH